MSSPSEQEGLRLPVRWPGSEELPVTFVNQFLAQVDEDEIYLSFGVLSPPVIVGEADEVQRQMQDLSFVAIKPVAKFVLTRRRLAELQDVLEKIAELFDTE